MRKELGKISKASFGSGGYDDAQFGLSLTFSLGGGGSAVGTFIGTWSTYPKHAQYSEEEWKQWNLETLERTRTILQDAKVKDINGLVGKPIEAEFEGNLLKDWRILTEVL